VSAEVVIEARGLTRRFGELVAVDAVDLSIERGEIFGCLGPNGSGKSTLMRMLLGLLAPSAGAATVLEHEIPRDAEHLRPHVGYMTQRFSLYEELSVRENLEFCAEIFGLTPRLRRARVASVLEESGLDAYRDTRAAALSGGWKQRLALAASSIHSPELLILDEPTAGVDPQSRREFWARLFEIAAAGATIFVSTHYMDEAVRCHRLCMLSAGRRVAVGTPLDLIRDLGDRVVELRLPDAERALRVLDGSPLVASTTQLGDSVHVLLAPDAPPAAQAAAEIAEFVAAAGLPDARVGAGNANLEDVFVALLAGEQIGGGRTTGGPAS
jgi:ABC-2 type transport system ATP-binding protein